MPKMLRYKIKTSLLKLKEKVEYPLTKIMLSFLLRKQAFRNKKNFMCYLRY